MEQITITRITSSAAEYAQIWDLREEVLRKPLGMSLKNEDLSRDHTDIIFTALFDNEVIGCVMLHGVDDEQAQLRQMAIYNAWQGKGVGRRLVRAFEEYATEKGFGKIILHARKVAVGFYTNLGYTISGDEFLEVGIPHFLMEKKLED